MSAKRSRWIVIAALALALAALLAWLFAPRPLPVETAKATFGPIAETVSDQGAARVRQPYTVAAPVSGRLQRIVLEVGDRVTAGQEIGRILPLAADPLDARSQTQAGAAVAAARAAADAAQADEVRLRAEAARLDQDLVRARALAEKGVTSPQALEASTTAAAAARAAVDAAVAKVRAAGAEVERAQAALALPKDDQGPVVILRAPAAGYITRIIEVSARTVPAGAPLLEIGDGRGLEAALEFLTQDAVRIRPGMAAEIYDWGGSGVLSGVVRRVEPRGYVKTSALGVEEQRALVLVDFAGGAPEGLGPGYRVWGRVYLRREAQALTVPLGALVRHNQGWAVFTVRGGRARLAPVEIGAITDQAGEVKAGLQAGDTVVVFPSDRVADGVRVRARR